ncbi:MAG: HAMP domain-containing sensor histidine kinase, partial [Planctomycetota bacterium]
LLKDERDPQRRQMLQSIGAQAYRVRDMIGDAMLFGRPPKPALQVVNLAASAAQVISGLKDALETAKCTVDISVASEILLNADPAQLAIVLSELIRNSRQALLATGGTIYVRSMLSEPGFTQIEVEDRGCGFTDPERQHAFDPFYSGRQAGRGLGFGLPKCWQIIRMHGGSIQIDSPPGGLTVVRVKWPTTPSC